MPICLLRHHQSVVVVLRSGPHLPRERPSLQGEDLCLHSPRPLKAPKAPMTARCRQPTVGVCWRRRRWWWRRRRRYSGQGRTAGESAAEPEPPSLGRCCTPDGSAPSNRGWDWKTICLRLKWVSLMRFFFFFGKPGSSPSKDQ